MRHSLIRFRDVRHIDLPWKNSGMFDDLKPSCQSFHAFAGNAVISVHRGVGIIFHLTEEETVAYKANTFSLVPPGCCNATGGRSRDVDPERDEIIRERGAFVRRLEEECKLKEKSDG